MSGGGKACNFSNIQFQKILMEFLFEILKC
jgi:hypothetical protein